MATCLSCKVSAISAFCRLTTQTHSISNRLVICHTKPLIAILVPKLVALTTSLRPAISTMFSPDSLTRKPTPTIKQRVASYTKQPKLYPDGSQNVVAMATSLSCKVSAISAFCWLTIENPPIESNTESLAGPPGIPVLKVEIPHLGHKFPEIPVIRIISNYLNVWVHWTCIPVISFCFRTRLLCVYCV